MIKLLTNEIKDIFILENFNRLNAFFNIVDLFRGEWRFFELTFTAAVTNQKIPHNLGFEPKDIIQTSKTGAGSITFNYSLFDQTYFNITTTGSCVVRFFAGTYKKEVQ